MAEVKQAMKWAMVENKTCTKDLHCLVIALLRTLHGGMLHSNSFILPPSLLAEVTWKSSIDINHLHISHNASGTDANIWDLWLGFKNIAQLSRRSWMLALLSLTKQMFCLKAFACIHFSLHFHLSWYGRFVFFFFLFFFRQFFFLLSCQKLAIFFTIMKNQDANYRNPLYLTAT